MQPNETTRSTPSTETLLSLSAAAKLVPGPPHVSTLWRWARRGINGCHLRHVWVGRKVYTAEVWLREFFDATTQSHGGNTGASFGTEGSVPLNHTKDNGI